MAIKSSSLYDILGFSSEGLPPQGLRSLHTNLQKADSETVVFYRILDFKKKYPIFCERLEQGKAGVVLVFGALVRWKYTNFMPIFPLARPRSSYYP